MHPKHDRSVSQIRTTRQVVDPIDDDWSGRIEENFIGVFSSLEDWAYELLEDTGELQQLPDHLRPYFDVKAYARDMELTATFSP